MLPIRPNIQELPASLIRAVTLTAKGIEDVIPLWFGEGDDVTPAFIREAAAEALHRGETFYGPNRGIPELRDAIQRYMRRIYGAEIEMDRIVASASAMNALMIAIQCLVGAGDSAVVIGPVWPNAENAIAAMGAEVRKVDLQVQPDGSWRLDLDRLVDACDATTRLIVVNSPSNPTGWMAGEDELRGVLEHARARGIWILADEVYARIVYGRRYAPSFVTLATADDPVVIVNSFSKSWSMTGWRLGWIIAPRELNVAIEKMTEFNISHPTTFAQWGGVAALDRGDDYVDALVRRYAEAAELVYQRLSEVPRVRLSRPRSAFYAFFGVDGVTDSFGYAVELIRRARVGLAPGVAFGAAGEGHLRLCFAASLPKLSQALDRLVPVLRG
ncbi:MAG: aminotransferase class I/II-fold pyridoxal phosphate-dependent enzyme [Deltaproteobacteria bacterium]|nr:MAG: aminotransferase class I/II-fold pyridoxal phosphate-dependent enzyme [Deltaproteobacteria bacterium]